MGKPSRDKGLRLERELVHLHHDAGIPCERVPLSGAAGGSYAGDLRIADELRGEVKGRSTGDGWQLIGRWLADHDLLFLRQDRRTPLVVMPWALYVRLMQSFDKER